MGILDFYNNPETQGTLSLAAALLEAGGPQPLPMNIGSALGRAYQTASKDQQQQQLMQLEKRKTDLLGAQAEAALRQQAMQQWFLTNGQSPMPTGPMMGGGASTPALAGPGYGGGGALSMPQNQSAGIPANALSPQQLQQSGIAMPGAGGGAQRGPLSDLPPGYYRAAQADVAMNGGKGMGAIYQKALAPIIIPQVGAIQWDQNQGRFVEIPGMGDIMAGWKGKQADVEAAHAIEKVELPNGQTQEMRRSDYLNYLGQLWKHNQQNPANQVPYPKIAGGPTPEPQSAPAPAAPIMPAGPVSLTGGARPATADRATILNEELQAQQAKLADPSVSPQERAIAAQNVAQLSGELKMVGPSTAPAGSGMPGITTGRATITKAEQESRGALNAKAHEKYDEVAQSAREVQPDIQLMKDALVSGLKTGQFADFTAKVQNVAKGFGISDLGNPMDAQQFTKGATKLVAELTKSVSSREAVQGMMFLSKGSPGMPSTVASNMRLVALADGQKQWEIDRAVEAQKWSDSHGNSTEGFITQFIQTHDPRTYWESAYKDLEGQMKQAGTPIPAEARAPGSAPAANRPVFSTLPPASQWKGKWSHDTTTDKWYYSNGMQWRAQ